MLVARREGRKIAANGGILIEQLINPACHDGEIAANGPSVTVVIFPLTDPSWGKTNHTFIPRSFYLFFLLTCRVHCHRPPLSGQEWKMSLNKGNDCLDRTFQAAHWYSGLQITLEDLLYHLVLSFHLHPAVRMSRLCRRWRWDTRK